MAGKVAAHFPTDLKMTYGGVTVRVTAAPTAAQPMDDDTHVLVPVTALRVLLHDRSSFQWLLVFGASPRGLISPKPLRGLNSFDWDGQ
ncbi:phage tail terminator-like protein [Mesorhizobium sp. NPDC059054]|uniref:phage tail terminator-like protein n=1 Tax=Mesorhizobium sp. NPDC059054 TaxID=3346711 RepID=UPI00368FDE6A